MKDTILAGGASYPNPARNSEMNIYLPNSAYLANIDGFIRRYNPNGSPGLSISSHERYIYMHPFALAMTACAATAAREADQPIKSDIHNVRSIPYLVRMKLFDFLHVDPPRQIVEHEEAGRFVPITRIRNSDDLKRVISELVPLLHAEPSVADPIRYVISELGRNVLEHSWTGAGGFACAQYYRNTKRIAIGMADSGIGIEKSIRHSHAVAKEEDAIYMALTPGITGVTPRIGGNETNAGAGLYYIKSIAQLSKNFFVIYSGSTMYKLLRSQNATPTLFSDPRSNAHSLRADLPYWQGTVVGMDIAVDQRTDFARLLSEIQDSYALDVRARKKTYYKKIRFT